ncbi:hypothetical protein [Glacieibacterium sp.]|uniref:hypothetical protein n=1 Tax=Glacieibacterium sp. TaxID=2860237 RepID=UPI003B00DB01
MTSATTMRTTATALLLLPLACTAQPPRQATAQQEPAAQQEAAATPVPGEARGEAMKAKVPTNRFIGHWVGPEGLYLDIAADGGPYSGRYALKMKYTLDDEGSFTGLAKLDTIVFERGGKQLSLRAGNGDETGMKWLAGKTDCLIVAPGEGYCRT